MKSCFVVFSKVPSSRSVLTKGSPLVLSIVLNLTRKSGHKKQIQNGTSQAGHSSRQDALIVECKNPTTSHGIDFYESHYDPKNQSAMGLIFKIPLQSGRILGLFIQQR